MSHSPDEDRDAHLLAALRHAPDRDVMPPAHLSAAILGRAQAAVQPPQAHGAKWARWRAAIDRLLRPAPMAAFGTVAMATLIGVMWSGQSPPDATPSLRPETMAAAPPAVSIAAPATADAPPAAPSPSPSIQQPPAPVARTSPPVARPQPPAAAEALQSTRGTTAEVAATEGSPVQPQPAAPAPRIAAAPRQTEAREPEAVREAAAKSMADAAPAARSRAEMPAVALGAAAPAAASPLTAPTIDLEAAVRSDPAGVRWRLANGRMAAHGAAQRDWWSALARATQGRWQAAAGGAKTGVQVTLTIDGVPHGSLVFEPNHLLWREPGGLTWRAPMAADTLREWQEALARW